MCFIEITSRKAYCYPLKHKNETEINEAYNQFLKDIDYKIVALTTDKGSEFISKSFQAIDEKYNVKHYYSETGDKHKMGKVERFNRTLRGKINKYLKANKTLNWVDVLPQLLQNYNNTIHSSTGYAPNDVTPKRMNKIRKQVEARKQLAINFVHSFHPGQKVRLLKKSHYLRRGQIIIQNLFTL